MNNNLDFNRLNAFLHLCYLPDVSTEYIQHIVDNPNDFRKQKKWMATQDTNTLVKEGAILLKNVFKSFADKLPENKNIIPLSGGLDSRAILALLIELGLKDNIIAVTYGTPGTFDYEIGKQVAQFAGVKNKQINLNKEKIFRKKLIDTCSTKGSWTSLTESYYNRISVNMYGDDKIYWSGFFGDNIAGSHYKPGYEKLTWDEAKKEFWDYNKWAKNSSMVFTHKEFDFMTVLPSNPLLEDPYLISFPEQLDLCIRQIAWIKKAIVDIAPSVITPFSHPEWISFMLAAPFELRRNSELYKMILINSFPEYYMLPTKNLGGKPLIEGTQMVEKKSIVKSFMSCYLRKKNKNINKGLNYIDFDFAYRHRDDFVKLATDSLSNLDKMKIISWVDIENLWDNHKKGKSILSQTIKSLISLEISCNYRRD